MPCLLAVGSSRLQQAWFLVAATGGSPQLWGCMTSCRGCCKSYHGQNAHLGITDESCCKQRQASAQAEGERRRCCGLVGVSQVVQVDTYQQHRLVSSFSIATVRICGAKGSKRYCQSV